MERSSVLIGRKPAYVAIYNTVEQYRYRIRGRKGGERRSRGGEGIENVLNRSYLILFPIQID